MRVVWVPDLFVLDIGHYGLSRCELAEWLIAAGGPAELGMPAYPTADVGAPVSFPWLSDGSRLSGWRGASELEGYTNAPRVTIR